MTARRKTIAMEAAHRQAIAMEASYRSGAAWYQYTREAVALLCSWSLAIHLRTKRCCRYRNWHLTSAGISRCSDYDRAGFRAKQVLPRWGRWHTNTLRNYAPCSPTDLICSAATA